MTDYSPDPNEPFRRLKWNQVSVLLSILADAEYIKADHIARLYHEKAQNFEETFAFLSALVDLRKGEADTIELNLLTLRNEDETRSWILDNLFGSPNVYRRDIFNYLQVFRIVEGEPRHHPRESTRHYESHIRNFLIELRILEYNSDGDYYKVTPKHIGLYADANDIGTRVLSPSSRASLQAKKESLGAAAEELILKYERQRVGQKHQAKVKRISIDNDAAGYDIRSVTAQNSDLYTPRYIEVKAVPRISNRFYWTQNEITVTKKLGEWYYLYLLPIGRDGKPIIDELTIVQNPAKEVLRRKDIWEVKTDVVQCRRRLRNLGGHRNAP